MENDLLQRLVDKSMTREELLQRVKQDFDLLPKILNGVTSSKATIRYGCANVLLDLSEEHPEELYQHMDSVAVNLSRLLEDFRRDPKRYLKEVKAVDIF